jgi:RNA polymerase sigma-B factor
VTTRNRADDVHSLFAHYRVTGDERTRERLVLRHLPLARSLAARYARGIEPADDLFQVACLALVKAVDRYDPERGSAFSSYAVPTILGELKRHFRDKTWTVRVPHSLHDLAMRVKTATERMTLTLGRRPSVRELAEALGVCEERILAALGALAAYEVTSLDLPCGDSEDKTLGDVLGDDDRGYRRVEQRDELDDLLRILPLRERQVVRLRFEEDLTQQEIGDRLGMSQMAVSRLLRRCLPQLREIAESRGNRAA